MSTTRTKLAVDLGLLALFVATAASHEGPSGHQWLGIALAAGIGLHLMLHRRWIATVWSRRRNPILPRSTRRNAWMGVFLACAFALTVVSGLLIAPAFRTGEADPGLVELHHLGAMLALLGTAIHLALHRKWLVHTTRRSLSTGHAHRARTRP
jgi:peptidoglycan biosynthesis protein MviN/MurJ (putative lipid II flippase)